MIIIIDGYNFIKQISCVSFVSQQIMDNWIKAFQEYMHLKNNVVIIVFDAGPYNQQSTQMHGALTIMYAGQRYSADDIIKMWVQKHYHEDVLVVSSDREIRSFVQELGIVSVDSYDFYKIFQSVMQREKVVEKKIRHTLHKTTTNQLQELDELMEKNSRVLCDTDVESSRLMVRVRNGKKVAKQDKRVLKKLEKI